MIKNVAVIGICCLLCLQSCIVPKKVVYVKDMVPEGLYGVINQPELRIQRNDRLSISVSAKDPELAVPFNQGGTGTYRVNEEGNVMSSGTAVQSERSFLVDVDGRIDFPILGSIKVADKTLKEVKDDVRKSLIAQQLILDPVVNVELLNLRITMAGEIGSQGFLEATDGKITLIEAISQSGGLTVNARPDKIVVIRDESGAKKMIVTDIRSTDIFQSPAYYLQQNDIVYITPKGARPSPREEQTWRFVTMTVSLVTMAFALITIFNR